MPKAANEKTVFGKVLRTTDGAFLFRQSDQETEVWIPWSLLGDPEEDEVVAGEEIDISVPEWFAQREGIV